jgi:hypothetical protein
MVRAIRWGPAENDPRLSLFFGAVAGFFVGLAYLIPQLFGAPDVLKAAAEGVTPANKIQFLSAVLIAFSAGIGFDAVFDRFKAQAKSLAVGVHHSSQS